eukprot:GHVP01031482.1.p3 GENE.GHVP01031482.1~~GHVP01031482.1.p3  ORF type:complete len:316 (+),score=93.17 GHVP01031482.1:3453-4400(+)
MGMSVSPGFGNPQIGQPTFSRKPRFLQKRVGDLEPDKSLNVIEVDQPGDNQQQAELSEDQNEDVSDQVAAGILSLDLPIETGTQEEQQQQMVPLTPEEQQQQMASLQQLQQPNVFPQVQMGQNLSPYNNMWPQQPVCESCGQFKPCGCQIGGSNQENITNNPVQDAVQEFIKPSDGSASSPKVFVPLGDTTVGGGESDNAAMAHAAEVAAIANQNIQLGKELMQDKLEEEKDQTRLQSEKLHINEQEAELKEHEAQEISGGSETKNEIKEMEHKKEKEEERHIKAEDELEKQREEERDLELKKQQVDHVSKMDIW